MKGDKNQSIRLSPPMIDKLKKLAAEDGRSYAGYIRRVLEAHLEGK